MTWGWVRHLPGRRRAVAIAVCLLALSWVTGSVRVPARSAAAPAVPAFDHVFQILFENTSENKVLALPTFKSFAAQNALANNYFALDHPSLPNYIGMTAGSTHNPPTGSDCTPDASKCHFADKNLADLVTGAGKTWKAYLEGTTQNCPVSSGWGDNDPNHVPWAYFTDITGSTTDPCSNHVVQYGQLATDLASAATTPNYVWITPTLCHQHPAGYCSGTGNDADSYLKGVLPVIQGSPAWQNDRSLLIVVWDEDDGTQSNQVYLAAAGSQGLVKTAFSSSVAYTHYSMLKTIEEALGLAGPLTANDGGATDMADLFVSGPPPPPTVPGAPTGLAATGANASVSLSWPPPGSNGGASVSGYKVYRGTTSGAESLAATLGNQTSFTDTGLTNGTPYFYVVSALNSVGEGAKSTEVSATPSPAPLPPTAPGAPTALTATGARRSVSLTWSAPVSDGGAAIDSYLVYRAKVSGKEVLVATLGNVTSFTDTGLRNGVTYFYQVVAHNSVGAGARSNEVSATPHR